jgi:hypothetical protein
MVISGKVYKYGCSNLSNTVISMSDITIKSQIKQDTEKTKDCETRTPLITKGELNLKWTIIHSN